MDELDLQFLKLHGKGYNCSQILMILALEMSGVENAHLVRAVGGLGNGLGGCGEVCGVLTGACCVLSYYTGKGTDDERPHDRLPLMIAELTEWFAGDVCAGGGMRCADILGNNTGGKPDPERCGGMAADAWHKILDILQGEGIDPSLPPGESHAW